MYYSRLKCRTFLDLFWHLKQLFIRLVTSHIDAIVLSKASLGCRKSADINVDILKNLFKKLIGWKLLIFSGSSKGGIYIQIAKQWCLFFFPKQMFPLCMPKSSTHPSKVDFLRNYRACLSNTKCFRQLLCHSWNGPNISWDTKKTKDGIGRGTHWNVLSNGT